MNLLFVCTWNVQRSKTAERICKELCKGNKEIHISSAGIAAKPSMGGIQITKEMANKADKIFVMEPEHEIYIEKMSPESKSKIINLNINDIYYRDDPELVEMLTDKINEMLKKII